MRLATNWLQIADDELQQIALTYWPRRGSNPHSTFVEPDFKSDASACFATRPKWLSGRDANPCPRVFPCCIDSCAGDMSTEVAARSSLQSIVGLSCHSMKRGPGRGDCEYSNIAHDILGRKMAAWHAF